MPYSDIETEFEEKIYPNLGEYTGDNLKSLKPFEIVNLEIPFTALDKVFPDPQSKIVSRPHSPGGKNFPPPIINRGPVNNDTKGGRRRHLMAIEDSETPMLLKSEDMKTFSTATGLLTMGVVLLFFIYRKL
jgi:hypothetical protein